MPILESDLTILQSLARRQLEVANSERNLECRSLWYRHNSFQSERPMVVLESGGVSHEFKDRASMRLECQGEWARGVEHGFRTTLHHFDNVKDDTVVSDYLSVNWAVRTSDYGVSIPTHRGTDSEGHTVGFRWDPPLANLDQDFDKLHPRTFSVDREATLSHKAALEEVFGGIMPVRIRGGFWWTMGMTMHCIYLRGLDNFMTDLYDNAAGVHRLMAFLRDDHLAFGRWLEAEGLLSLNNANDYIGSGSYGFTTLLPQGEAASGAIGGADAAPAAGQAHPAGQVRLRDMWVLLESQETVGVSPSMFEEFIAPYQRDIAAEFGLTYYGCCEPVHSRWSSLAPIGNLHSVSVSPWCDEALIAESLGARYVYSRKPSPALISTGVFDEAGIREDLEKTLRIAKAGGCTLELIMKDVHTLHGDSSRMGRWVELARQAIERIW